MKASHLDQALKAATNAANAAGIVMRRNIDATKTVNESFQYDLKLELDVRCQEIIQAKLQKAFPSIPILGEEGDTGDIDAEYRWVVDPIDGTVNFAYGIPYACVSIALQQRTAHDPAACPSTDHRTLLGMILNPFSNELWSALPHRPAKLNKRVIQVSNRTRLADSIVATGFSKRRESIDTMFEFFSKLLLRARKVRMLGAAALHLAYVSCGRMDAYVEHGINLWDIAAGGYIIERAGGGFWTQPLPNGRGYLMIADNRRLQKTLRKLL